MNNTQINSTFRSPGYFDYYIPKALLAVMMGAAAIPVLDLIMTESVPVETTVSTVFDDRYFSSVDVITQTSAQAMNQLKNICDKKGGHVVGVVVRVEDSRYGRGPTTYRGSCITSPFSFGSPEPTFMATPSSDVSDSCYEIDLWPLLPITKKCPLDYPVKRDAPI